ncbi:hypothetical protein [Haloplanus halobius]|uniref:hypothetical protein n=1 Tax=Haloplanus halobius TaxID=2934938 RepID=UPI00200CDCD0|nr:hypothetical protein [Haloplanus sp. XH21]
MTCDDCEDDDDENEERPEVSEGVLRGIEDIAEGNTASKEDLENLCDIDGSDHPDPALVEQAERVLSLVRATMYPVAHGEAYRLQEMLEEWQSEDSEDE